MIYSNSKRISLERMSAGIINLKDRIQLFAVYSLLHHNKSNFQIIFHLQIPLKYYLISPFMSLFLNFPVPLVLVL